MSCLWKFVLILSIFLQVSLIHSRTTGNRVGSLKVGAENQGGRGVTNNFVGKAGVEDEDTKIGDKNKEGSPVASVKNTKILGSLTEDEGKTDSIAKSILSGKKESGKGGGTNAETDLIKPSKPVVNEQLNKPINVDKVGTAQDKTSGSRNRLLGLPVTRDEVKGAERGLRNQTTGNVLNKSGLNVNVRSRISGSTSLGQSDNPQRVPGTSSDTRSLSNAMVDSTKSQTDTTKNKYEVEGTGIKGKTPILSKDSRKGGSSLLGKSKDGEDMRRNPKGDDETVSAKSGSKISNLKAQKTSTELDINGKEIPKLETKSSGIAAVSRKEKDGLEGLKSNLTASSKERNQMKESEKLKGNLSLNSNDSSSQNNIAKTASGKSRSEGNREETGRKPIRRMGDKFNVDKEKLKDSKTNGKDETQGMGLGGSRLSVGKGKAMDGTTDDKSEGKGLNRGRSNVEKLKPVTDTKTGVERTNALSDKGNADVIRPVSVQLEDKSKKLDLSKNSDSGTVSNPDSSSKGRIDNASSKASKTKDVQNALKSKSKSDVNSDESIRLSNANTKTKGDNRLAIDQREKVIKDASAKSIKYSKNIQEDLSEEKRRDRLRKIRIYSDDNDQGVKSSHFIVYGTIGLILLIVLYVVYQKRQKILALIVEGRRQRGNSGSGERSRRGSGNIAYKPLSSKEEPADERPESLQKYIY